MAKTKKQVTLLDETITALEAEGMGSLSTGIELVYREWSRGSTATTSKPAARKEKTFDLPDEDDPLTPYRNHPENPLHRADTAARLYKEAKAAQEAFEAPRRWFAQTVHDKMANPSSDHQIPDVINHYAEKYNIPMDWMLSTVNEIKKDADGSIARERAELLQAWAELYAKRDAEMARKKQLMDAGYTEADAVRKMMAEAGVPAQTLKLSPAALKAANMDSTPDWMTDEQIAETNALHAMTPAAKAEVFEQPATQSKEPTLSELWAANPLVIPEEVEVLGPGEVLTDE